LRAYAIVSAPHLYLPARGTALKDVTVHQLANATATCNWIRAILPVTHGGSV
jgi:hypothetical protein